MPSYRCKQCGAIDSRLALGGRKPSTLPVCQTCGLFMVQVEEVNDFDVFVEQLGLEEIIRRRDTPDG